MDEKFTPVSELQRFLDGLDENVPTAVEVIAGHYYLCVYDKQHHSKIFQMEMNKINQ